VRIRTAYIKAIAVSYRLYHSYMVSAVEMLEKERLKRKLNSVIGALIRKSLHIARRYVHYAITSPLNSSGKISRRVRGGVVAVDHVVRVFRDESVRGK